MDIYFMHSFALGGGDFERCTQRRHEGICRHQYAEFCFAKRKLRDHMEHFVHHDGNFAVPIDHTTSAIELRTRIENGGYRIVGIAICAKPTLAVCVLQFKFHRCFCTECRHDRSRNRACYDRIFYSTIELDTALAILGMVAVFVVSNLDGDRFECLKCYMGCKISTSNLETAVQIVYR